MILPWEKTKRREFDESKGMTNDNNENPLARCKDDRNKKETNDEDCEDSQRNVQCSMAVRTCC